MTRDQIYKLGKAYAHLAQLVPDQATPERFNIACINPLAGMVELHRMAIAQNKMTDEADKLFSEVVETIDMVDGESMGTLSLEQQGVFQIGYYSFKSGKGESILRLLKEKNMTQTELANRMGVTGQTIYRWCHNIVTVSNENYEKILEILK